MSATFAATAARPQAIGTAIRKLFALSMLTLLAACSTVIPKGGEVPDKPVTDEPGNVVAGDATRHRVALLLPVSGPDGEMGQAIANATTLALLDTKNTNIRMTTYDTALGIDAAVKRAVADGNRLILGPLRGDQVVDTAKVATPAGVPIISFSNDVGAAGRNVFLLGHLPNQSIDRVVRFAKTRGMTRFGGIVPKTVYGQRAIANLTKSVRDAGGTLVSIQESDGSATSVDAAARKLAAAGQIDAILIADSGRIGIATVPAIRRNGLTTAKILGTDLWNIDGSLTANTAIRGAWFASVSDGLFRSYSDRYKARFGKIPPRLSSLGYDGVLLVARVAKDWKVGTKFPVAQLTDPEGFIGVDGAFRFLPSGMSERMLAVQEVSAGKFVTVDPAPKTFPK